LLCDPEDTVLFTENLVSVMQNKKLRSELSKNAIKTAMTRDWDNVFDCLVDVYYETIDSWLEQNIRKTA
jgi:glycosyltransferase involved in cell wall biosynthesis